MIHHLILLSEKQDLRIESGQLKSGDLSIAVDTLGSIQCLSDACRWTQSSLVAIANQCPSIFARFDRRDKKWKSFSVQPRARHVNPSALWNLCRLKPPLATSLSSELIFAKICNQHLLLRAFQPELPLRPQLKENSFSRILRLEAQYARFFWPRYLSYLEEDLFEREKRRPLHPLNQALSYGYGFLYHCIEWQCYASGLDPTIGLIHRLRKNRPSLACDLIEPLRCVVELTVARNWENIENKQAMAVCFAEMMESRWAYKNHQFRLRAVIRLMVESFVQALNEDGKFQPFRLTPLDACL
jgi:CRISPR-associated endonuclease Cas1